MAKIFLKNIEYSLAVIHEVLNPVRNDSPTHLTLELKEVILLARFMVMQIKLCYLLLILKNLVRR